MMAGHHQTTTRPRQHAQPSGHACRRHKAWLNSPAASQAHLRRRSRCATRTKAQASELLQWTRTATKHSRPRQSSPAEARGGASSPASSQWIPPGRQSDRQSLLPADNQPMDPVRVAMDPVRRQTSHFAVAESDRLLYHSSLVQHPDDSDGCSRMNRRSGRRRHRHSESERAGHCRRGGKESLTSGAPSRWPWQLRNRTVTPEQLGQERTRLE